MPSGDRTPPRDRSAVSVAQRQIGLGERQVGPGVVGVGGDGPPRGAHGQQRQVRAVGRRYPPGFRPSLRDGRERRLVWPWRRPASPADGRPGQPAEPGRGGDVVAYPQPARRRAFPRPRTAVGRRWRRRLPGGRRAAGRAASPQLGAFGIAARGLEPGAAGAGSASPVGSRVRRTAESKRSSAKDRRADPTVLGFQPKITACPSTASSVHSSGSPVEIARQGKKTHGIGIVDDQRR